MRPASLQVLASASLIALIFLCLLWESILAPIKPGGSLLMLKALPLLVPLFGVLRGRPELYSETVLDARLMAEALDGVWRRLDTIVRLAEQ